jgi:hypothetical protein
MRARDAALVATVALLALLTFLTIEVILESGFDILVVASLGILLVLGFGVIGALTHRPDR